MIRSRDEALFRGADQYELKSKCIFALNTGMIKKNRFECLKKIYSLHSMCNQGIRYDDNVISCGKLKCALDLKLVMNNISYAGDSILDITADDIKESSRIILRISKNMGQAYPSRNRVKNTCKLISIIEQLLYKEVEALNMGEIINSCELLAAIQTMMGIQTTRKFSYLADLARSADRILKEN